MNEYLLQLRAVNAARKDRGCTFTDTPGRDYVVLKSRLRSHLACLREDAADPALSALQRLALVRDRARRIQPIRQALAIQRRPS